MTPQAIAAVREARKSHPVVLGVHLEGPFLDPARKGAHQAKLIRAIAPADVETIAAADCGATMLTVAPNRVPVDVIRTLPTRGVLVSLGHAEASYAEAQAGLAAGARAFTHLYNAMSPLRGREPGMVGAALDSTREPSSASSPMAATSIRPACASPSPPNGMIASC